MRLRAAHLPWRRAAGALALALVGCGPRVPRVPPAFYPYDGFGRLGCYAGTGLPGAMPGTDSLTRPDAEAAARAGPWLVVDSLDARPYDRRARVLRVAHLVTRVPPSWEAAPDDTLRDYTGAWRAWDADSIGFREETVWPSTRWAFRRVGRDLRGYGTTTSDVVVNGVARVWTRRVWLVPVPCATVPREHRRWPPGGERGAARDG